MYITYIRLNKDLYNKCVSCESKKQLTSFPLLPVHHGGIFPHFPSSSICPHFSMSLSLFPFYMHIVTGLQGCCILSVPEPVTKKDVLFSDF